MGRARDGGWLAVVLAGILSSSCGGDSVRDRVGGDRGERRGEADAAAAAHDAWRDVTPAQWHGLASRRIFFGHQSVGANILAGVCALAAEHPDLGLNIVRSADPSSVAGPALIEAVIGRNGDPASKADAFAAALAGGFGREPGAVALYKYCYLDMTATTNADAFFADYRARTTALHARYPGLVIVHVTMPLTVAGRGPREFAKRLLGRPTAAALNAKRQRFNALVRANFAPTEPVFDLAEFESTRPGGTRSTTRYHGADVETLAPEWTDDGGHLNAAGQRMAGERFLVFLARLATVPPTVAVAASPIIDATAGAGALRPQPRVP